MSSILPTLIRRVFVSWKIKLGLATLVLLVIVLLTFDRLHLKPRADQVEPVKAASRTAEERVDSNAQGVLREPQVAAVFLDEEQQQEIALKTERVTLGTAHQVLIAPGRIAPDETRYAQITPRAAGVIRTVVAVIGQEVRAGDLLATVDSPEVGRARLELYTQLQALEVAQAQADWQETVYNNAVEFAECLQRGDKPEEVQRRFEHRAIGEDREKLMTAYANYRLPRRAMGGSANSMIKRSSRISRWKQARVQLDVSLASYQSLMDQVEYQAKLALTRARQALRQSETAVRVAKEQFRILGIRAGEGSIKPSEIVDSNVAEQVPANTAPGGAETPMIPPPPEDEKGDVLLEKFRTADGRLVVEETPVSTYALRAPFDGTILDRENIVPGVYVDTTHPGVHTGQPLDRLG